MSAQELVNFVKDRTTSEAQNILRNYSKPKVLYSTFLKRIPAPVQHR
jgi:hypothetical protein